MSSSKFSFYDPSEKIWSGPKRPCLYNTNVSAGYVMLNALKNTPDRIMQVCDDSGLEMSCKLIYERAIKMAKYLSENLKLKECDIAGFVVDNSANVTSTVLACLTLGLPINPLATIMKEPEISFMYSMTKPKVIFCDESALEKARKTFKKIGLDCLIITMDKKVEGVEFVGEILENFAGDVEDFDFPHLSPKALSMAAIQSSSGTSTKTKGIVKPHCQIIQAIPNWSNDYRRSDSILVQTPIFWSTAYWFLMATTVYGNKQIISQKEFDPKYYYEVVERHKPTVVKCQPFFGKQLLESLEVKPMESVRLVIVVGATFSAKLIKDLERIFPNAKIGACYGCTEGDAITFTSKIGEKGTTSGTVCPNYKLKIIDEIGNPLGPNEKGQICFKHEAMFTCYFNEPELTKEAFDPKGWAYSGDVGYFDDEGSLYIVDRLKFILKFKEFIFTPLEVEEVINQIEGVKASCVVGVRDLELDYDITYAFIIKEAGSKIDEKFVKDFVDENASEMKRITGEVIFVEEFPTTPTKKIKINALKEIAKKIHEHRQNKNGFEGVKRKIISGSAI